MTNKPEHKLKPCPFCGAAGHVTEKNGLYRVECKQRHDYCSMNMRTHHTIDIPHAVDAWNTRTDLAEAEIESLKAQIPQWISVEDRLPEDFAHVLTIGSHTESITANRQSGRWYSYDTLEWITGITHWMPIPEIKAKLI